MENKNQVHRGRAHAVGAVSGCAKIAALQMVSGADVATNLATAARLIEEAATAGAQLVVLPEYFFQLSADDRAKIEIREAEASGPLQTFLAAAARRHGVWLLGGTVPLQATDCDKVRNSLLVFDDSGKQCARYDKLHLFGFHNEQESYDEAATIEAGSRTVAVETPFGRLGLAICYDLRFPELFRAMGVVDLIALPAAFTHTTGQAHWEVLLRARAIENQCYVIAAAQGGQHPHGRRTWGHSLIVDPWGQIVACLEEGEGIVLAELELEQICVARQRLPALAHRRLV